MVSERGEILGFSNTCSPTDRYNNAQYGYSIAAGGIASRCQYAYAISSNANSSLKLITSQKSQSILDGRISYSQTFSDDLIYNLNGLKRLSYNVEDTLPTPLLNKWAVANYKEVVQPTTVYKMGKRNVSIDAIGFRGTALSTYLDAAKTQLNNLIPTNGTDIFISDCSYNYSSVTNKFDLSLSWGYSTNNTVDLSPNI